MSAIERKQLRKVLPFFLFCFRPFYISFAPLSYGKHIFIVIFLLGMIFTVVNYLPLIEEVSSKKIELAKKAAENSDEDGGDGPEDDSEDFCHVTDPFQFRIIAGINEPFRNEFAPYPGEPVDKSIPPPRS
jgi:hypothetical protein